MVTISWKPIGSQRNNLGFVLFLQFQDDKRINISISPNLSSRKQSSVFHTASFWDKTLPQQQQGEKAKADSYPNNTKRGRKYKNLRKLWFGKTLFNHSHTRNLISWAFSRLSLFSTQNKHKWWHQKNVKKRITTVNAWIYNIGNNIANFC